MEKYTLIGFHTDTEQVWSRTVTAADETAALAQAAQLVNPELLIIGVIAGAVELVPADIDGGRAAYAVDLADLAG